MAELNFDGSQVELDDFDDLPVGFYDVIITESEMKQNNAKTGQLLKLVAKVVSEYCKGRQIWINLNLVHPNPVAVNIARQDLKKICLATLKTDTVKDSAELHNIPFTIQMKMRKNKQSGEERPQATGFFAVGVKATGAAPGTAAAPAAPSAPAAKAAPAAAAWPKPSVPTAETQE